MNNFVKEAWDYYVNALKNNYANFTGRIRRREYWMFILVHVVIMIVLSILEEMVDMRDIFTGIYGLALIIPSLAMGARRLHDIGKSGWWLLISIVPLVGAIVLIIFAARDSQPGANEYGPNPKEGAAAVPVEAPVVTPEPPAPTV